MKKFLAGSLITLGYSLLHSDSHLPEDFNFLHNEAVRNQDGLVNRVSIMEYNRTFVDKDHVDNKVLEQLASRPQIKIDDSGAFETEKNIQIQNVSFFVQLQKFFMQMAAYLMHK